MVISGVVCRLLLSNAHRREMVSCCLPVEEARANRIQTLLFVDDDGGTSGDRRCRAAWKGVVFLLHIICV